LTARGPEAERLVSEAERLAREILGKSLFGSDQDQLESVIVRELTVRKATVAVAESCTGGYFAKPPSNVPGASAVFLGGFVTYSNASKENLLGVRAEILAAHGAVSEPTAREMAEGARFRLGATYALAVTGIAGPSGGRTEKPVGTVYIAWAG